MKFKISSLTLLTLIFPQLSLGNIEGPAIGNNASINWSKSLSKSDVPIYSYEIIQSYPHDENCFTEGLLLYQNNLYESCGLYQQSKLRKVDITNGKATQEYVLPTKYFGEGITTIANNLYQLSYETNIGFIYDVKTFKLKNTFHYPTQGWGLTTNGKELIMSNGSSSLLFLDPANFNIKRYVIAHHNDTIVGPLNGLAYAKGKIFANIYGTELIAIINPSDGKIEGWINLNGLFTVPKQYTWLEVLNGIAYDTNDDTLIVTGKLWPKLFKIKIVKKQ